MLQTDTGARNYVTMYTTLQWHGKGNKVIKREKSLLGLSHEASQGIPSQTSSPLH